jgi:FPC/CPF motif-containing protein YcgG
MHRMEPNIVSEMHETIITRYLAYLDKKAFPCVGAKAALARQQVCCMVADNMETRLEDQRILHFMYTFIDAFRNSPNLFHSAAIIFTGPAINNEERYDALFWNTLQSLSSLDAKYYPYDTRVNSNTASHHFSFSLKSEALYVIGLNPKSSRMSRRFAYPAIVFNPHSQFEKLREEDRYLHLKEVIRKRDIACSGSVNPMLLDFGAGSEVYQYSGMQHPKEWQCPLKIHHAKPDDHSAP